MSRPALGSHCCVNNEGPGRKTSPVYNAEQATIPPTPNF